MMKRSTPWVPRDGKLNSGNCGDGKSFGPMAATWDVVLWKKRENEQEEKDGSKEEWTIIPI